MKRRYLTLIELMVVLAIIASLAGVIGLSIKKALREQRFKNEVEEFVGTLRLAQNLMLIADADIHVRIRATPEGIHYKLESDQDLPEGWKKELARASRLLKSIHHVTFDNATEGAADLKFLSGGSVMSRGNLMLDTDDARNPANALRRYIFLPGYPYPIRSSELPRELPEENKEATEATVQEILALEQKEDDDDED